MTELFSGATMHWHGTNLVGATDAVHAAYRANLDAAELPAGALMAHRLEKLLQSPRRSFGPDYLSVVEFDRPTPLVPPAAAADAPWAREHEQMWRLSWRKISDTGPAAPPVRARLLSLSPPADASDVEVAVWNRFYTDVHVPEAMQRRRWSRATRWELETSALHPAPGAPRYFVLYEATSFTDATDAEVAAWGPWTEGPPIWKRHVGAWTLDYRTIAAT